MFISIIFKVAYVYAYTFSEILLRNLMAVALSKVACNPSLPFNAHFCLIDFLILKFTPFSCCTRMPHPMFFCSLFFSVAYVFPILNVSKLQSV